MQARRRNWCAQKLVKHPCSCFQFRAKRIRNAALPAGRTKCAVRDAAWKVFRRHGLPTSPPKTHQPLLGVIPRECPSAPLGELLFEVETCKADSDCWPRICCPDGTRSYCRTARARLDLVPVANQIDGPVRMLEQYLQCTPPPQYDLFPQKCSSSVDCFPNLCCAEGGKKHCRPPQRSLLALLAGVGQVHTNLTYRQHRKRKN